jgi:glycine cleavage system H lipoate-binding protein
MRCPFLQETQVQYCADAFFGKLIPLASGAESDQKCNSPDFLHCPTAKSKTAAGGDLASCPFLQVALVQYCDAASIRKFVPYTDSLTCRCVSETFRYCPLYLNVSRPAAGRPNLFYSANHLWLEMDENGLCHIGIDDFLARLLGEVERIHFLQTNGTVRPCAVVTARGVDLHLAFPNRILLMGVNSYLRARPERVSSDPYRQGWMFEGRSPSSRQVKAGLRTGGTAVSWLEEEIQALAQAVRDRIQQGGVLDGLEISSLDALTRKDFLQVALQFCAPHRSFPN